MIRTCADLGVVGLSCASRLPLRTAVANVNTTLFMSIRRMRSFARYGIRGIGSGATPQIAEAHGGKGGVGIRDSLP
jgi:hypothetical protein